MGEQNFTIIISDQKQSNDLVLELIRSRYKEECVYAACVYVACPLVPTIPLVLRNVDLRSNFAY